METNDNRIDGMLTHADNVILVVDMENDFVLPEKQRFSAFFGTDLDIVVRGLGAKNIYVTGTQYPNCIRSTAVDSMSLDYNTVVVTDCCSAASDEVAKANIFDIRNMGISCVPSTQIMNSSFASAKLED